MGPGCPAQLADSASSFVRTPPPSSSSARRPTRSASASLRQAARIPHEQLLHCRHSRSPNCIGYTGGWNCSCRATVGFLERTGQSALSRKGTRRPRHCEAPFSFRRLRSAELLRQMLCRARSQRFHGLVYFPAQKSGLGNVWLMAPAQQSPAGAAGRPCGRSVDRQSYWWACCMARPMLTRLSAITPSPTQRCMPVSPL
jgi:hypothetical protein